MSVIAGMIRCSHILVCQAFAPGWYYADWKHALSECEIIATS